MVFLDLTGPARQHTNSSNINPTKALLVDGFVIAIIAAAVRLDLKVKYAIAVAYIGREWTLDFCILAALEGSK